MYSFILYTNDENFQYIFFVLGIFNAVLMSSCAFSHYYLVRCFWVLFTGDLRLIVLCVPRRWAWPWLWFRPSWCCSWGWFTHTQWPPMSLTAPRTEMEKTGGCRTCITERAKTVWCITERAKTLGCVTERAKNSWVYHREGKKQFVYHREGKKHLGI